MIFGAMRMRSALVIVSGDGRRYSPLADALVAAMVVSLPWSTSATGIMIALWLIVLIALIPNGDLAALWREVCTAAGGLPILLWALGAVGMLWADVSWSERLAGLSGFHKLLVIPILLAQFRAGGRPEWAILGFLASSAMMLLLSWGLFLTPGLTWRGSLSPGVAVKDYVLQSTEFTICACGLLWQATECWRTRRALALAMLAAAALFVANVVYVATARTTLVVLPILVALFGWRRFGWKGVLGVVIVGGVLAAAAWASSPYLRTRVTTAITEVQTHTSGDLTAVGLRLDYWKMSLKFVAEAPLIGHGTGTIGNLFRRDARPASDPMLVSDNPHNQLLAVAIPLGLLGAVVLVALWIAHLALFGERSLIAWLGLTIVVQTVVGSLFNSFLFDFSHGWLYVLGVGIAGGVVLHGRGTVTAAKPATAAR